VDLDGVRYRSQPGEDGKVVPIAVKRGEMVPVDGRKGDWIMNSNGYLPLKHPVDDSCLFLFDHKRSSVGENEALSEGEASDGEKLPSSPSRMPRSKQAAKIPQPNLQGESPRRDELKLKRSTTVPMSSDGKWS